jgi:alkylation response protein AidB-like acyl-CoA dehydrogenase
MAWGRRRPSEQQVLLEMIADLERKLEAARNTATTFEQMLHMTPEERDLFTKPQWKAAASD